MNIKVKQCIKDVIPYAMHEKMFPKSQTVLVDTHLGEPQIFNANGNKMRVFYLQDRIGAHFPYMSITSLPQKILWDRYNYTLPVHFYGSRDITEIKGTPRKRFAWFTESETIDFEAYEKILHDASLADSFDAIFTFSERVLDTYSNARFIPAMQTWYGSFLEGGEFDPLRYERKKKNISMICSNKASCEWHRKRNAIAGKYKNSKDVKVLGSFTGTFLEKKAEGIDDFRYSIVVENDVTPYYFTEKILDCFGSMTVPIYIGASKIGEFFNSDGMIIVNPEDYMDMDGIIASCSAIDYESRKEAIIDNYLRVQKYINFDDYLIEHYASLF